MTRRSMGTAMAAVLGIAVSAALAWAASQLSGQRVGLSAEPLSVATGLSPRPRSAPVHARTRHADDHPAAPRTSTTGARPAVSSTTSAPAAAPVTTTPRAPVPAPVTTVTRTSGTVSPGAGTFAPASTATSRQSGHHGDGGDQHDD